MSLPENIQSQIINVITGVLSEQVEVILFGSYSKGNENKYSDIDIAIKSTSPLDVSKWSRIEELFEESQISQKIDVVDYNRVKDDFKRVIDHEGFVLFPKKVASSST